MRLAVVVIAPAGRKGRLGNDWAIRPLLEDLVPSLGEVYLSQKPRVDLWPPQLSSHGFMRSLFANAALGGKQGKGTPWVALAGRLEHQNAAYLVGLIGCADRANSLGEISIEQPGEWLNVLRIRVD